MSPQCLRDSQFLAEVGVSKLVCLQITVSESMRTWEGEQLGDDLVKVVKPFDGVHRFHIAVLPCDQRQQHRRA